MASERKQAQADYQDIPDFDEWVECWNCGGDGRVGSCFEDTCVCFGYPDDPDTCCAPHQCDVCQGKGGWAVDDTLTATSGADHAE